MAGKENVNVYGRRQLMAVTCTGMNGCGHITAGGLSPVLPVGGLSPVLPACLPAYLPVIAG